MPSPLGHALGGLIAGGVLLRPTRADGARVKGLEAGRSTVPPHRFWWRFIGVMPPTAWAFAVLGAAADLDLLVGRHSRETHSLGAVLVVGLSIGLLTRRARLTLAATAAYASHIGLDWLGRDTVAPIGIMALWPLTADFYQSSLELFDAISRHVADPAAWWHNARAVTREVLLLGPLAALIWWQRGKDGVPRVETAEQDFPQT